MQTQNIYQRNHGNALDQTLFKVCFSVNRTAQFSIKVTRNLT